MRSSRPILVTAAVLVAALAVGGCSTVSHVFGRLRGEPAAKLEVRAPANPDVARAVQIAPSAGDRLYLSARGAIARRDYGAALDLLQLAKEQAPNDPRILNGLAVTYDKLGRFDLASRYYGQALDAEPGSPVVQANMRYSQLLQGRARAAEAARMLASTSIPVVAPAPVATPAGPVLARSAVAPVRAQPILMGGPLLVINASGRPGGQEPVRSLLAQAGWTVKSRLEARPVRPVSEVRFAEVNRPLAEALARTLPFEVALQPCGAACAGLELWVGENARVKGTHS